MYGEPSRADVEPTAVEQFVEPRAIRRAQITGSTYEDR